MEENQDPSPPLPPDSSSTPTNPAPDDMAAAGAGSVAVVRRVRGRPPGTGKIQKLTSLGGTLAATAGSDFKAHVLIVEPGEDVVSRIISYFYKKTPEAVCILSASGQVSSVVIGQSGASVRHEGPFEIVSLSGQCTYTRGAGGVGVERENVSLTVALAKPDGNVFGGVLEISLIAATPIQVHIATFKQMSIRKQSKKRNSSGSPKGDQDSAKAPSTSGSMPEATPSDLQNIADDANVPQIQT